MACRLTCWSTIGARAHPPRLSRHDSAVRLGVYNRSLSRIVTERSGFGRCRGVFDPLADGVVVAVDAVEVNVLEDACGVARVSGDFGERAAGGERQGSIPQVVGRRASVWGSKTAGRPGTQVWHPTAA